MVNFLYLPHMHVFWIVAANLDPTHWPHGCRLTSSSDVSWCHSRHKFKRRYIFINCMVLPKNKSCVSIELCFDWLLWISSSCGFDSCVFSLSASQSRMSHLCSITELPRAFTHCFGLYGEILFSERDKLYILCVWAGSMDKVHKRKPPTKLMLTLSKVI